MVSTSTVTRGGAEGVALARGFESGFQDFQDCPSLHCVVVPIAIGIARDVKHRAEGRAHRGWQEAYGHDMDQVVLEAFGHNRGGSPSRRCVLAALRETLSIGQRAERIEAGRTSQLSVEEK
jgi:hypothetical protein